MRTTFSRLGTLAGLAVLSSISLAQSWDDKVTLTVSARGAKAAVAELAKTSGLNLSTRGLAQNDVVLLHLKDVTVRVAAEKLAAATGSKWVEENGAWILTRTQADEREQWKADAKARKDDIEAAIKQMKDAAAESPAIGQGNQGQNLDMGQMFQGRGGFQRMQVQTPGARAALELIDLIPSEQLASMNPGERWVYATRPTKMQRNLPSGTSTIVTRFIKNELAFQETMLQNMVNRGNNGGGPRGGGGGNRGGSEEPSPQQFFEVQGQRGGGGGQQRFNPQQMMEQNIARLRNTKPAKTYLILQNQNGSINARLEIIDDAGTTLASGNLFLMLQTPPANAPAAAGGNGLAMSDGAKGYAQLFNRPQAAQMLEGAIQIEGLGEIINMVTTSMPELNMIFDGDESPEAVAEAVRSIIARPDLNEPLSLFTSELFVSAANADQSSLVANLPDSAFQPSAALVTTGVNNEAFWKSLDRMGMTFTKSDGVVTAMPKSLSKARYEQMNRNALAGLIADAAKNGYASLKNLGDYALESSYGAFGKGLDMQVLRLAHFEGYQALRRNVGNQEMLCIYASLNAAEKKQLTDGQQLRLAGQGKADDHGEWLVYNSTDGPQVVNQRGATPGNNRPGEFAREQMFQGFMGVPGRAFSERTDLLPNGLPNSTLIQMRTNTVSMLRASENLDQSNRAQMVTPESLGAMRAQRDNPANANNRNRMPDYRAFTNATQASYTISLLMPDQGLMITRTLQETQVSPDSKPVTIDQLPADVQQRIQSSYQRTLEAMQRNRGGGGGGGGRGGGGRGGNP